MTRRNISRTERVRIFERAEGKCHICGQAIDGTRERWEVEHIIPYALTRDETESNLAPAHERCHATKTPVDVRQIAKAKRVAAKHIGAKANPVRPMPGSRASKWKRRVDGTVVLRGK